jgi:hypothetical protein
LSLSNGRPRAAHPVERQNRLDGRVLPGHGEMEVRDCRQILIPPCFSPCTREGWSLSLSMGGQEPPIQWNGKFVWMAGSCPAMERWRYAIAVKF